MVRDESTDRCDPELRIGCRWAHEQIYSTRQRDAFCPPATTRVISLPGDGHNEIPNSLIKADHETVTRYATKYAPEGRTVVFICHKI